MDQGSAVAAMATVRFLAAAVEIIGACLMLFYWRLHLAIKINTLLGVLGPCFFLLTSIIGISAAKPSPLQLTFLFSGLILTFLGLR